MTSPWPYLKLNLPTQMTQKLLLLPEQSIYCFIVLYRENQVKNLKKINFYVKENKFISKLSLIFDNYVVFTVNFVIERNLRSFYRNFW